MIEIKETGNVWSLHTFQKYTIIVANTYQRHNVDGKGRKGIENVEIYRPIIL